MNTNKNRNPNICLITSPRIKASIAPLSNLIAILIKLSTQLYIITGNMNVDEFYKNKRVYPTESICIYCLNHRKGKKSLLSIISYLALQLKASYRIHMLSKSVDSYVFFLAECFILPLVTAKISKKPVYLSLGSSALKTTKFTKNDKISDKIFDKIARLSEKMMYFFSDYIILYSPSLVQDWNLEKYDKKVLIAHEHFLDFENFKLKCTINERNYTIGYIGRLSPAKGVVNFINAIPYILSDKSDIKITIAGEGELESDINLYLMENTLNEIVQLESWIPHEELPNHLNNIKLLVISSYTEGLPNILLEAMACGTAVLANPVGVIPDIIKDETNGFIMENNSPECIAKNVIRALNHPNFEDIIENARNYVVKKFTYECAVDHYRKVLMKDYE